MVLQIYLTKRKKSRLQTIQNRRFFKKIPLSQTYVEKNPTIYSRQRVSNAHLTP